MSRVLPKHSGETFLLLYNKMYQNFVYPNIEIAQECQLPTLPIQTCLCRFTFVENIEEGVWGYCEKLMVGKRPQL